MVKTPLKSDALSKGKSLSKSAITSKLVYEGSNIKSSQRSSISPHQPIGSTYQTKLQQTYNHKSKLAKSQTSSNLKP